jgi:hypothetical protein
VIELIEVITRAVERRFDTDDGTETVRVVCREIDSDLTAHRTADEYGAVQFEFGGKGEDELEKEVSGQVIRLFPMTIADRRQ